MRNRSPTLSFDRAITFIYSFKTSVAHKIFEIYYTTTDIRMGSTRTFILIVTYLASLAARASGMILVIVSKGTISTMTVDKERSEVRR